ncbi:MAG: VCBS repeat-containing protein, partial [Planctomycetota bacterium]
PGFGFTDTSRSAFFRDVDHDGDLDILVANDSNSGTATNESAGKTKLFRQSSDGTFENVSQNLSNLTGAACNACSADFDNNGYPDLYLANYANISQDSLALNNLSGNQPGIFSVVTSSNVPSEGLYSLHAEAADMNGDGFTDIIQTNWTGQDSHIFYNNNGSDSSGPGDFKYTAGGPVTVFPGIGGGDERCIVPADFNGDGLMDLYFGNAGGFTSNRSDAIYVNVGNDEFNRAEFEIQPISDDLDDETMKVSISDLDLDRRPDLIVMSEFRRPFLYRNVSENGEVRFLEWTPGVLGNIHAGWRAVADRVDTDERPDLLVGATNSDFLFKNQASDFVDVGTSNQVVINDLQAGVPRAYLGKLAIDEPGQFTISSLTPGSQISLLLRSFGDLGLEVLDSQGNVLGESDFDGHGSDEAIRLAIPADGEIILNLSVNALAGDSNGDGGVNLLDVSGIVDCLTSQQIDCDFMDLNDNGRADLLDVSKVVEILSAADSRAEYVLEFLNR